MLKAREILLQLSLHFPALGEQCGDIAFELTSFLLLLGQRPLQYRRLIVETECSYGCPIGSLALELHDADPIVRDRLAENFTNWVDAVEACLRAGSSRFRPGTDFRGLAELALNVMEGGVMQSRTFRDVAPFDRAVAQYRAYLDALLEKEAAH